jgi:hypothetical protein
MPWLGGDVVCSPEILEEETYISVTEIIGQEENYVGSGREDLTASEQRKQHQPAESVPSQGVFRM